MSSLFCKKIILYTIIITSLFFPIKSQISQDPLEQITEIELYLLRERNNFIFDNIKTSGNTHNFKESVDFMTICAKSRIQRVEYCPPIEKAGIATIYRFLLDVISELTQLIKDVSSYLKEEKEWRDFLNLNNTYYSNILFLYIYTNFKVQFGTVLSINEKKKEDFFMLKRILKQNQNDENIRYIDQLFNIKNRNLLELLKERHRVISMAERERREAERERREIREEERERTNEALLLHDKIRPSKYAKLYSYARNRVY